MGKYTREEELMKKLFGTDIEAERKKTEEYRIAKFYEAEKKAADKVRDERGK